MWTDPIVEEVRKHRREIEKACDNDFDKIRWIEYAFVCYIFCNIS